MLAISACPELFPALCPGLCPNLGLSAPWRPRGSVHSHPATRSHSPSDFVPETSSPHFFPFTLAGRNINNLRYADDTTLMAESEEELKGFLMKLKEESEDVGLKLNIQKMKIMDLVPSLHGK